MQHDQALPNEHDIRVGKRLGRRKPSNKPALALSRYLTSSVPAHPASAEHFSEVQDWGLYGNDRYGDCGPVSVANSRKLVTRYLLGTETSPSQDAVFDLYRRSGNSAFDPATDADDNGVDMQTMLEAVVKGGIDGVQALGFAKVDPTNLAEIDAAISIFGFVLYGVDLEVAQQTQTEHRLWDYQGSAEWGGHAVLGGRYLEDATIAGERRGAISWAIPVDMTDSFLSYQLEEVWVVIWPEHLQDKAFVDGMKLETFAEDYRLITGRPFPAPIPAPAPAPTPTPTPAPTASVVVDDQKVVAEIQRLAAKEHLTPTEWANNAMRHRLHIREET